MGRKINIYITDPTDIDYHHQQNKNLTNTL